MQGLVRFLGKQGRSIDALRIWNRIHKNHLNRGSLWKCADVQLTRIANQIRHMTMKEYLIETFLFNDGMNKNMLKKMNELTDKEGCVKYFSHLINSQNKWMARIVDDAIARTMSWWDPVYPFQKLEGKWNESLQIWIDYLQGKTDQELFDEVEFTGYDGGRWKARLIDIALQLNYHSIHHRAQMQMLVRQQGIEPDFIDYIGTKYKRV